MDWYHDPRIVPQDPIGWLIAVLIIAFCVCRIYKIVTGKEI